MFQIKTQIDFNEASTRSKRLNDRHKKAVAMMTRKNQECDFQG